MNPHFRLFLSIYLLTGFFLISNCTTDSSKNKSYIKTDSIAKEANMLSKLVSRKLNSPPFYISELQNDSTCIAIYVKPNFGEKPFFYSDTMNRVYVSRFKLQSGKLKELKTKLIFENFWSYLEIDSASMHVVKINSIPYFCCSYENSFQGQAITEKTVYFNLINLNDFSDYKLSYVGEPTSKCDYCIEGSFEMDKELKKNPLLLKYLKQQSKNSNRIYQASKEDENLMEFKNYEEKWNQDNKQVNSFTTGNSEIKTPIKTTYYKTNLFELNGSISGTFEDENYVFVSYFRGNLIGFDKTKGLYFPIIIEKCTNGCNKDIKFSNNSLLITYENEENYKISMEELIFDNKIGN